MINTFGVGGWAFFHCLDRMVYDSFAIGLMRTSFIICFFKFKVFFFLSPRELSFYGVKNDDT